MRITNNMMVNNMMSSISRNLEKMSRQQDQMATGKSINSPSDDPIAASKILKFNTDLSELDQFTRNTNDAISWLETTETAVSDINSVLQRARELAVSAANGTNTATETSKIRQEVDQLKKILVADGNNSYAGRYVFSSFQTDKKLLNDDGTFNIDVTDLEAKMMPVSKYDIGIGEDIEVNTHGLSIFEPLSIPDVAMRSFHPTPAPPPAVQPAIDSINSAFAGSASAPGAPANIGAAATRDTGTYAVNLTNNFGGMTIRIGNALPATGFTDVALPATGFNNPTKDQLADGIRLALGSKGDAYIDKTGNIVIKAAGFGPLDINAPATKGIEILSPPGAVAAFTNAVPYQAGTAPTSAVVTGMTALPAALTGYEGKQFIITLNNVPQKITLQTAPAISTPTDLVGALNTAISTAFPSANPALTASLSGGNLQFSTTATPPFNGVAPTFEVRAITAKTSVLISDFNNFITALDNNDKTGITTFLGNIDTRIGSVLAAQSDIGARSNRLDMVSKRINENSVIYTRLLSSVQDADMGGVIMQLKNSENVYKASLSAGARIIQPSLVDFLR